MEQDKCYICGSLNNFRKGFDEQVLFREEICGECGGSRRNSAVAYAILRVLKLKKTTLRTAVSDIEELNIAIYETASSGIIHETLKTISSYVCSEYFDETKTGEVASAVRCENLEKLTFADNSFDIIINQDVLEHVNDYEKSFSEIQRVLKKEGTHVFSIPFNEAKNTQLRVGKNGDKILPLVFHGDSIRKNGIIVTVDYGKDLLDKIDELGFETEITMMNKWHEPEEITWIESNNEYENYMKFRNNPLAYFKYNNEVFISKKMDKKKKEKNTKMEFTGERMIPEFNDKDEIYLEHITRYMFAAQFVENKVVLDIACGSGYGSDYLLKSGAKEVIGVDISNETIEYCKDYYLNKSLKFLVGSVEKIPAENNTIDIAVSFETIEHVNGDAQLVFLNEIKRVLKPNGIFIVSTPNTLVFPKGNTFHLKELEPKEFSSLLEKSFANVDIFYQDNTEDSFIFPEKELLYEGKTLNKEKIIINKINRLKLLDSMYLIAVCKNFSENIQYKPALTLSNIKPFRTVYAFQKYFEQKDQELQAKDQELQAKDQVIQEKDQEIISMKSSKFWKMQEKYMSLRNKLKK